MDTFLQLNRDKIRPAFIRLSIISSGLVIIVFAIAYLTGNLPSRQLILTVLLTAAIAFPLFLILLGYIDWLVNRNARQKIFSLKPFDQIDQINFYKAYEGEGSKWTFAEEIKKGKLNGFDLTADISKEKKHILEFDIPTEWKKFDKTEYKRLTEKFQEYDVEFRIGSLVKQYNTKSLSLQTISDLRKDLELVTNLLKQEGFKPKL